jgi:hypothetical protein
MVEKSNNQIDIIPIRAFIKEKIENGLKYSKEEQKRNFISKNGR